MKVPKEIVERFRKQNSFLTHVHLGPDPDSVGSVLALKLGLEQIGKVVRIFCEDTIPVSFSFLPEIESISNQGINEALSLDFDAYVSLDTAKWALATRTIKINDFHQEVINVDHHGDNNIKTKYSWIESLIPCNSIMILYLFKRLGVEITPQIATCIIYGILGDTGNFQNLNTTPEVMRQTADLIDLGGDYQSCVEALTRSFTIDQLKAIALLINNMKVSPEGDFVYMTINSNEWQRFDKKTDVGSFANMYVGRVAGTKFGATLIEKVNGITKGAIRAKNEDVDVSQIARLLNGGGHKASSGFRLEKNLKNAEKEFLNAVAYLKSKGKI